MNLRAVNLIIVSIEGTILLISSAMCNKYEIYEYMDQKEKNKLSHMWPCHAHSRKPPSSNSLFIWYYNNKSGLFSIYICIILWYWWWLPFRIKANRALLYTWTSFSSLRKRSWKREIPHSTQYYQDPFILFRLGLSSKWQHCAHICTTKPHTILCNPNLGTRQVLSNICGITIITIIITRMLYSV